MLVTGMFVFCQDELVIQVIINQDTTALSHEFDLFYHYSELQESLRGQKAGL